MPRFSLMLWFFLLFTMTDTVSAADNPLQQLLNTASKLTPAQDELLPPEQAFQFFARVQDAHTVKVEWIIAPDYYLYREKIQLTLNHADGTRLGEYHLPQGEPKDDEAFGKVEVFHNELSVTVPLTREHDNTQTLFLIANYQGCADRGVCYPPMEKTVELALPSTNSAITRPEPTTEQDQIALSLKTDSLALTLLSFFGFGLLLAFTPCIFPMIPILSGIIVGHGNHISTLRAFILSLSYVIASALAYTVFGILAALFGQNLQAASQQPWLIAAFSMVFVVLSCSMFGFYNLELPNALKTKVHNSSVRHQDGSLWGAAIMGVLSSLIVGPCVAAPLAGALIYIGQTGDALLGGSALFMLGLGMGFPLLLLGASAGRLLPKAGAWLNATKAVFGVLMLAMAVWMLSRILPPTVTLLLCSMLLILPAIYLNALDPLPADSSGWRKLWKGVGLMMLVYGVLLLIGVSMGNGNPLKPLQVSAITNNASTHQEKSLHFERVTSLAQLDSRLHQAALAHQRVMLDFYADWCIACKEMESYTFTDNKVKQALAHFLVLRVDVTANNAEDKTLLAHFNLIGPPAILFFNNKAEQSNYRVIGYQTAEQFLQTLQKLPQ